jgi:NADH-quinone oxidoreductase subunit F
VDIRVVGPDPSPAERDAVDSVLGPSSAGAPGGARDLDAESGAGRTGGRRARSRRDLLLPALLAVQARAGWVSQGALNYVCRRLTVPPADAYGVATFYHLLSTTPRPPVVAHVCDDIACRVLGGERLCAAMEKALGPAGKPSGDGRVAWRRSPCLGQCERAPAVMVTAAGESPRTFTLAPADEAGRAVLSALASPPDTADTRVPAGRRASPAERRSLVALSVPQAGAPGLRLLRRVGTADPESLEDYRGSEGYAALRRAVEIGPKGVVAEVTASRLVGRGGAAFPTGRKWEAVAGAPAHPHYLVCNADESEPGTFKDRILMEEDPFAVLEGMTIGGFAAGCERGYVYLRGEYPLAAERLGRAVAACRAAGLLGRDVMGAGFAFDVEIRRGGGAYICGEETALFNSIEGKRGEPRNKPPFPVQAGLFGKPTVVNNVETLANVPVLLREGSAAFAGTGTPGSAGPKLYCVSGHVARPGLYEFPFGATLREAIGSAGGVPGGRGIRAILLGGAAGSFVGPAAMDAPLTFEGLRAVGASLGSGVIMVFDETVDLLDITRRIAAFFRDESCGQCVPCRVGTVRQEELLARLQGGRPLGTRDQEFALLKEIGQVMRDASICGLGQTASTAVESALFQMGAANRPGGRP